jgi:hypothetical protein
MYNIPHIHLLFEYIILILIDMAIGKVVEHLCLALILKKLKISVEQGRVVTTLNVIKH